MATDAPREFSYDRHAKYRPANYGGGYSMRDVTLRDALVRSLNVVTVDVAMRTGLARVAALAEDLGLPRPAAYPSLALGSTEATPLEVATAYTAFANNGQVVRPTAIARFDDANYPAHTEESLPVARQVVRPSTSYMLTDMLTGVISEGTARAARGAFKGTAVAGKTGTSRDGWFAGYTPNLVCVVWVGFDDGDELGLTGAESALPVWQEFVKGAVELRPELGGEMFERPDGIVTVEIDPETGALASASCPARERIALTPALAPGFECLKHGEQFETLASLEDEEAYEQSGAVATIAETLRQRAAKITDDFEHQYSVSRPAQGLPASDATGGRATRVEINRSGRPQLTNELRVRIAGGDGWQR
jgi:penicillin-binding protein 1B